LTTTPSRYSPKITTSFQKRNDRGEQGVDLPGIVPYTVGMPKSNVSRRNFITEAGALAVPLLAAVHAPPLAAATPEAGRRMKVLCIGGHPDDPESGCAGTLSRYSELGHSVTVLYLTRGERGIVTKGWRRLQKSELPNARRPAK
jgi:hypothetical protein